MVSTLPGWTHVYPAITLRSSCTGPHTPGGHDQAYSEPLPRSGAYPPTCSPSCKERRASSQKPGKVNAMLANSEGCARAVPGDQIMLHLGRRLTRRKRTCKPTNILVTPCSPASRS